MIYILYWTTKKHQKNISRPLHSKLKKMQGLFKDLHRNIRTFQGKMEFKDFSRTSPKIQGLFKTVWTLWKGTWCSEPVKSMLPRIWFLRKSIDFQVTRKQKKGANATGWYHITAPHMLYSYTNRMSSHLHIYCPHDLMGLGIPQRDCVI